MLNIIVTSPNCELPQGIVSMETIYCIDQPSVVRSGLQY